jgi:3-oxoadipate enol-lactonase
MNAGGKPKKRVREQPPALVFLHAFGLDSRMWRPQVLGLGDEFRVLTVDLPGFGAQARPLGDVEPATELARAMDVTGLVRAHLVAASFGGAVAIDFALKYPKRVQSLTLVGPLLLGRRTGLDSWARAVELANEGDRATAIEIYLDDPLLDGLRSDEQLFEDVRQIALDYSGFHWTGKVSSRWLEPEPLARLHEITAPALVMSGEADLPSFMLMAEAYAKAMPNARRDIVPGAGHFVNLERPELFNEVLRTFLKSL